MPKVYKHIFFDLDHTLWDFDRNAEICLTTIFEESQLALKGIENVAIFISTFSAINKGLWNQLDTGKITHDYLRKQRFRLVLSELQLPIDEQLSLEMNERFLELLPNQKGLIDGATELLEKLSENYRLHILSNGYYAIQLQKMKSSGIYHFFEEIITNDIANARKPDVAIFRFAVQKLSASMSECLMVGDTYEADILGAHSAGMDVIHFEPTGMTALSSVALTSAALSSVATYTVKSLSEILAIV